mmetsp:Transcript_80720/g.241714  ORF Transcript_80720/g.241714 Transcript_80720/m.241714 type:complete len:221 (+) Transcript_80720:185-847(+)
MWLHPSCLDRQGSQRRRSTRLDPSPRPAPHQKPVHFAVTPANELRTVGHMCKPHGHLPRNERRGHCAHTRALQRSVPRASRRLGDATSDGASAGSRVRRSACAGRVGVEQQCADDTCGAGEHHERDLRAQAEHGRKDAREHDRAGGRKALPDVVGILDHDCDQQAADAVDDDDTPRAPLEASRRVAQHVERALLRRGALQHREQHVARDCPRAQLHILVP